MLSSFRLLVLRQSLLASKAQEGRSLDVSFSLSLQFNDYSDVVPGPCRNDGTDAQVRRLSDSRRSQRSYPFDPFLPTDLSADFLDDRVSSFVRSLSAAEI